MPAIVNIDGKRCVGCEQCVAECPTNAIRMQDGIAVVDPELCIGCGKCLSVCPVEAITLAEGEAASQPAVEPAAAPAAAENRLDVEAAPEVWVWVEHLRGVAAPVSWELVGHGARLAGDLGGRVAAVVLGRDVQPLADAAIAYGAARVYLIDDPVLEHYRTEPYLRGMTRLIEKRRPEVILLGATTTGRDLAGAVATTVHTGLTADCTGLTIDPVSKLLEQTRPAYGGNIMATILCEKHRPQMATVRPRVMPMPERDDARRGEIVRESPGLSEDEVGVKLVEYLLETRREDQVRLEEASVIVAGGRGLGGPKGFGMLRELAQLLHGEIAASRAAVDSGWMPQFFQVGQTGKTVRPKVYFACGISGAIQHLVGMQTADVIVAINRDPSAPIFQTASYGIVGDVYRVVPAIIRAVKQRLGGDGQASGAA
jgi:electron transfer flavoprotein alpha subunit